MAASFTGAYFSRDTTDNTSLYLTLYGGTDVPAESSYDNSYSHLTAEFKFSYPESVTNPTYTGIRSSLNSGTWSWNSSRTEVTVPMHWGDITDPSDGYLDGGSGESGWVVDWYAAGNDADDWKQVDKISPGPVLSNGYNGISIEFRDTTNQTFDEWKSWNNTSGVNTYNGGNMQIFNSPTGTAGRKNIYDTGGFKYNDISAYSSSGGATGDPHITTFNGNKYTL